MNQQKDRRNDPGLEKYANLPGMQTNFAQGSANNSFVPVAEALHLLNQEQLRAQKEELHQRQGRPDVRSTAAGMTPLKQHSTPDTRMSNAPYLQPTSHSQHFIDVMGTNPGVPDGFQAAGGLGPFGNTRNSNPAFKLDSCKEVITKEQGSHMSSIKSDNPLSQLNEFEKSRGVIQPIK